MLSIIVPVYRNEATLPELLGQIARLAGQFEEPLEMVFVIDGSPDNSYTLLKQRLPTLYFLDSVFAFSDLPINLLLVIGALGVTASVGVGAAVVLAWWSGRMPVVGYTPLMLVVERSFSATIFALGVIGAYVWRVFENTKPRPPYIPVSVEVFDRPGSEAV